MEPSLRIGNRDNGERLDAVLARTYPQYSRVFFQKFLKRGGVTLSGKTREPSYRVRTGEVFQVAEFEFAPEGIGAKAWIPTPAGVRPNILFEDDSLLVIHKPAGLVVHPAPGHRVGTLMDWLKSHLGPSVTKVFTDPERLGLVHRLDKDTSGVLLIAKSIIAQTAISRQFHDRTVQKTYVAFVEGVPTAKVGVINAPVGRSRKVPTRMAVSPLGRESETSFELLESYKEVSLVSVHPKTGRTHQIRVHLSAIGHPIVGDRTYGAKSIWAQTFDIHRPLLHAERLKVTHPATGKAVTFHAPWPADFHAAQKKFRQMFKALLVSLAIAGMSALTLPAEETAGQAGSTRKSQSTGTSSSGSSSSASKSLSSDVRRLKKDYAALEETLAGMTAALEKMNADVRLRDLERVASELNARAVGGGASAEETKTQLLDINRKLKSQSEAMDQLRDQVDRLQAQLIKQQSAEAPATGSTPPAPGSPAPKPASTSSEAGGRKPWGSR